MFSKSDFFALLDDGQTHRKQFSANSGVQKAKSRPTFSVPFDNGLVEHFFNGTGLRLKWNATYSQFYCFLNDDEAAEDEETSNMVAEEAPEE